MILLLGPKKNSTLLFLEKKASEMSERAVHLDPDDLCQWSSFNHRIGENGSVTSVWEIPSQDNETWSTFSIDPKNIRCVINFLGCHLTHLFQHFDEHDQIFAKYEYHAGLLFALSQFPRVINAPQGGRLSGFTRSLPQQWLLIREICPEVSIPKFSYQARHDLEFFSTDRIIVADNIYKTNLWRPQKRSPEELSAPTAQYQLLYERPNGSAIISTYVQNCVWTNENTTPKISDLIHSVTSQLASTLELDLATALFFYDAKLETLTFGSITPSVSIEHLLTEDHDEFARLLLQ